MSKSKYYKLPAEIVSSSLSPRAQIVYAVLADRQELSRKSGDKFRDEDGFYIIYKRDDLCALLGVGRRTCDYAIAELEDSGLVRRKKQGQNLPVKIYVDVEGYAKNCASGNAKNCASGNAKNCASGCAENCAHIYTDSSNTDISSSPSGSSGGAGTGRGLVRLIAMIDSVATETQISLNDDQVYKLLKKVRKQGDKIGNLRSWLRAAVTNISCLPATNEDGGGYAPTYDLDAYAASSELPDD